VLRPALLLAVVALASGCGGSSDEESDESRTSQDGGTNLEIRVWPSGEDGPLTLWTLTCPAGGTLPDAARACERLEELGTRAFAPTPKDVVCAQIYGGPEVAEVTGTFEGRPVNARFTRIDACEMERWKRVEFLFARSGPT
jgi:hypothetical protein